MIDLEVLQKAIDRVLQKETKQTLRRWLKSKRSNKYLLRGQRGFKELNKKPLLQRIMSDAQLNKSNGR